MKRPTHKQTAGQPRQKDDDEANLRLVLAPNIAVFDIDRHRTTRITDDTTLAGDETKTREKKRGKINRNKQSKCRIDLLLFTSTAENSGDRKCSKNSPAPVAQHQKVDPVRLAPMISGPTPVSFLCSFPLTIGCVLHQQSVGESFIQLNAIAVDSDLLIKSFHANQLQLCRHFDFVAGLSHLALDQHSTQFHFKATQFDSQRICIFQLKDCKLQVNEFT